VAGKLPPVTVNPVPEIASELIVTAAVPLEVSVNDFVTAVPTATLPNDSEVTLAVKAGVAALSCTAKLFDEPFVLADSVAVCAVVTDETVAVNEAEDAPGETVTLAGTVTEVLLLPRVTTVPPDGAAELSVTVHVADPAPVNKLVPQENALSVGAAAAVPEPLRLTVTAGALLESVNCPLAELAAVGEN
jgi:hypothetical protein